MRHNYPVEQLLRPPVELYAAASYLIAAVLVYTLPSVFLVPDEYAVWLSVIACLLGAWRLIEGLQLKRYQYQLYQLPGYIIPASQVPASAEHQFFGLGFSWKPYHTQRRADLERSEWRSVTERDRGFLYRLARTLSRALGTVVLTRAVARLMDWPHYLNPVAPRQSVEGDPTLHGVGLMEAEHPVTLPQSERNGHVFVVGTTRVGKTRLAEVLISQDIHNNDVVIVFDPKGDADLLMRMYTEAQRANRLDHFYVFHLGFPALSARYNPIGDFSRITEVASRIASQLPGEGQSAAFREFTWRYVNVITKALFTLGEIPSYEVLLTYGSDIDRLLVKYLQHLFNAHDVPNWQQRLQDIVGDSNQKMERNSQGRDRIAWAAARLFKPLAINDSVAHALIKTFEYDKAFYDKLVASLFPLLEKLTSGEVGQLLSPDYADTDDPRPIIDWRSVIRQGAIVYVGLDALTDAEVAGAVGASMFADLTSTAGDIYKELSGGASPTYLPRGIAPPPPRRNVCLHADEFNELVGKEFVPMCNKAGGAGFQITAYTQTLSDIEVRFGDKAKAGQVIGNLGTVIMLRVKERATADLLTEQLREVDITHLELQSLTTDSSNPESTVDFTSRTGQTLQRQRVPLIHPNDVLNLPKGHAFALIGGTLYKLRLPLFESESELPDALKVITTGMRQTYRQAPSDWRQLPERYAT